MSRLFLRSRSHAVVAAALLAACGEPAPRTAADSQAAHVAEVVAAGGVVDSILPIAEQLRRFRDGMTAPDTMRHAAASREALVRRWLQAVSASDTVALNKLVLDRAEFAFLYYPTSAMSQPPYEAPPQLLWGQILASSNEGLPKVLARFAGQSVALEQLTCPDSGAVEGDNRVYGNCAITVRAGAAAPFTGRLFGSIIERQGRFKFLGYANAL
jgi:hypothetical protein